MVVNLNDITDSEHITLADSQPSVRTDIDKLVILILLSAIRVLKYHQQHSKRFHSIVKAICVSLEFYKYTCIIIVLNTATLAPYCFWCQVEGNHIRF